MEIEKDSRFLILDDSRGGYVFYNGVKHFACRLDRATLSIVNLIYTYGDLEIILKNIKKEHHGIVSEIFNKVKASAMLKTEDDEKRFDYRLSEQIPQQYYLHLTYACNLGCTYCYNKDIRTHRKQLEFTDWCKVIDKILQHAESIVLTGGEPFLNKDISQIISYIKSSKPSVSIEIISNCMHDFETDFFRDIFLNINAVTFSCDSIRSTSQERLNFSPTRFIHNILYLRSTFKDLNIGISSTFIKDSEGALDELAEFARENKCGARNVLLIPNSKDDTHLLPSVEAYSKRIASQSVFRKIPYHQLYCGAAFGVCSIDPLGNIYPCQNMHYNRFLLGNIFNINNIKDLFLSSRIRIWRSSLSVENIPTCNQCVVKYVCGAGCRASTFRLEGGELQHPKVLCEHYKVDALNKIRSIP